MLGNWKDHLGENRNLFEVSDVESHLYTSNWMFQTKKTKSSKSLS